MKVLIVEDEPVVRSFLRTVAERAGYETRDAEDGRAGWEAFQDFRPDLVLTDIQMPNMSGLDLLARIRGEKPEVIVVVLTGYGTEETAVEALRLRANNYLQKPVRRLDLDHLFKKYEAVVKAREVGERVPGRVVNREMTLEYDNQVLLVPRRAEELVRHTGDMFDEKQRMGLLLGLIELLANAMEHGNLEIGGEEKEKAMSNGFETYQALLCQRLANPVLAARQVTVEFKQKPAGCQWVVSDEGKGFGWRSTMRSLNCGSVFRTSRRGIYLSSLQFDHLEYLGAGNKVRAKMNASSD